MTIAAALLVLLSAGLHVYWNLLVKQSSNPAKFTWVLQGFGALAVLPIFLAVESPYQIDKIGWICISGTGACYAGYYMFMARSYECGDLSSSYPIVRGVAPVAAAIFGVIVFSERPSGMAWTGILAVCSGVGLIAWSDIYSLKVKMERAGVVSALITGFFSAGYLIVDKEGVRHVPVLLYLSLSYFAGFLAQWLVLLGMKARGLTLKPILIRSEVLRANIAGIAASLGYVIILFVMKSSPLSYVVPLRCSSIMLTIAYSGWVLKESISVSKCVSAVLILGGIIAISFG